MAHHFILPPEQIGSREIFIEGRELEHLSRVLRLKTGTEITVADTRGQVYNCTLEQITKTRAMARIDQISKDYSEPPVEITLLQGLPKGDKLELIIQKGTELGVSQIIPIAMSRSVVRLSDRRAQERRNRWERVALEGAKQCGRNRVPKVELPVTLSQGLEYLSPDSFIFLPWEGEVSQGLEEVFVQEKERIRGKEIALVIGPEGGMTPEEVALVQEKGGKLVSLGPRILRTETAAIASLAILMYLLGDLGGKRA